jgi:hypothetical protein
VFATEASWDGLAEALVSKYDGLAARLVMYNALGPGPDRLERMGEVARRIRALTQ